MDGLLGPTDFALDFATPVEGAGAAFDDFADFGAVAAAAAHQVAAVDADRRLVADAALRAGDAQLQVLVAEIRRVLVVDQVFLGRSLISKRNSCKKDRLLCLSVKTSACTLWSGLKGFNW